MCSSSQSSQSSHPVFQLQLQELQETGWEDWEDDHIAGKVGTTLIRSCGRSSSPNAVAVILTILPILPSCLRSSDPSLTPTLDRARGCAADQIISPNPPILTFSRKQFLSIHNMVRRASRLRHPILLSLIGLVLNGCRSSDDPASAIQRFALDTLFNGREHARQLVIWSSDSAGPALETILSQQHLKHTRIAVERLAPTLPAIAVDEHTLSECVADCHETRRVRQLEDSRAAMDPIPLRTCCTKAASSRSHPTRPPTCTSTRW